jgi:hypothetical protein
MKKLLYVFAVLLLAGTLFSCSSAYKSINSGRVADIELQPLAPDRYIILGEVEGYGTASGLGGGIALRGRIEKAKRNAEFQAISKVEGADMLLAARYEIETFVFPLFFSSAKVKVKAKAVRIKATDEK